MIDMQSETTFKTLKIVNVLYRHMAEEHCRHTYSDIVREALGRKGLRPTTTSDAATTIPEPTRNDSQEVIR